MSQVSSDAQQLLSHLIIDESLWEEIEHGDIAITAVVVCLTPTIQKMNGDQQLKIVVEMLVTPSGKTLMPMGGLVGQKGLS